jgi:hypothetical protein
VKHHGKLYWVSEIDNDSHFPNFGRISGGAFKFNYVPTKKESYFTYSVVDGCDSMWTLGFDGRLTDRQSNHFLVNGSICIFNSSDHGCV